MQLKQLTNSKVLFSSIILIGLGIVLVIWLLTNTPDASQAAVTESANQLDVVALQNQQQQTGAVTNTVTTDGLHPDPRTLDWNEEVTRADDATERAGSAVGTQAIMPVPVAIGLADGVPLRILQPTLPYTASTVTELPGFSAVSVYTAAATSATPLSLAFDFTAAESVAMAGPSNSSDGYVYTFAAATRFDTIDLTMSSAALQTQWQFDANTVVSATVESTDATADERFPYTTIAVLTDTLPALTTILGNAGTSVVGYATPDALVEAAWAEQATLVLIPFDLLHPRLAVLAVDGQTPVENANNFDAERYPLRTTIYAHLRATEPSEQQTALALLNQLPVGNRNPDQLTVVAMTGVTAMVRLTANEMDQRGYGWPAEVVGPLLSSADITVISNEVPFVPGCQTDTRTSNLTFCSKPEYMEALRAVGVDIIGLTGNHQNDFGREDAITSLEIYEEAGLPVYGGGRNKEEAFAPLYLEHNGNRLAFLGANSYGPNFAWATDDLPGSAEFDLSIMSATIRNIKLLDRAAVVLAELQYQESYEVTPLLDQRQNFNALVEAGADIVTGVQSHVPQAIEFTDGKLILYGLGNLFFDQMWSQATREGLIVKHTIYNNRHISTQVFTTMLYDYGQPQWTTPEQNRALLERVYGASYW